MATERCGRIQAIPAMSLPAAFYTATVIRARLPVRPCKNRADEEESMGCHYVDRFLWSVALFLGISPVLPAQPKGAPVFSKDIAPILYQHCASCHRGGQI